MATYIEEVIKSGKIYTFTSSRYMITDRTWENGEKNIMLAWWGNSGKETINITPEELEILYKNGKAENVVRQSNDEVVPRSVYLTYSDFGNGIVCGVLAPSTVYELRREIREYLEKKGYITEDMTPIEMQSGTKSLFVRENQTFDITFKWSESTLKGIDFKILKEFTNKYFKDYQIRIDKDSVTLQNLSEDEVFSQKGINLIHSYDIQLHFLKSDYDKQLLLRALLQRMFVNMQGNLTLARVFRKVGDFAIPKDVQRSIKFDEYGKCKLNCGKLLLIKNDVREDYIYELTVPYSEYIRELMKDAEKILRDKYKDNDVYVGFSPFNETFSIGFRMHGCCRSDIQRDLITLDYAVMLLQEEFRISDRYLGNYIFNLLELDSSGELRDEYYTYTETLQKSLPEKGRKKFNIIT